MYHLLQYLGDHPMSLRSPNLRLRMLSKTFCLRPALRLSYLPQVILMLLLLHQPRVHLRKSRHCLEPSSAHYVHGLRVVGLLGCLVLVPGYEHQAAGQSVCVWHQSFSHLRHQSRQRGVKSIPSSAHLLMCMQPFLLLYCLQLAHTLGLMLVL
jgi:hypothetical protein